MKNIEFFKTEDGSIGLYNKELKEVYHSKFGARTESIEKFIIPAKITDNHPLDILDVCYGIGYNTKYALEIYKKINSIDCIETDKELVSLSFEFNKPDFQKTSYIRFFVEDARKIIPYLNKKYDIIFHDGFAPHKQSILWSEEFIFKISKLLKKDGIFCTYNHSKPVLNALVKAGLTVGKTKCNSTVASFNPKLIENPLSGFELGQLNTKSAITYKDSLLNLTHDTIIKNRKDEIDKSNLESLSSYLKQKT